MKRKNLLIAAVCCFVLALITSAIIAHADPFGSPIGGSATGGSGDVSGPGTSTDSSSTCFNGTGGKTIKECGTSGGLLFLQDGNGSAPTADGRIKYDRLTDRLQIGDGASTVEFYNHTASSALYPTYSVHQNLVCTCTDGDVIGTDCCTDKHFELGIIVQFASGTITLPSVASEPGAAICGKVTTAAVGSLDTNVNDRPILDGSAGVDGEKYTSDGTLDATICVYVDSADGYRSVTNPGNLWSNGGL